MSPKYRDRGGISNSITEPVSSSPDWVGKAKRIGVIIGLVLTFIGLVAKAFEVLPAVGRAQALKEDLDKVYERTHRDLEKYSNRP